MSTITKDTRMLLRRPGEEMSSRLFCFPYSGIGASMFSKWPAKIGGTGLCFVQLPGRENRIREPHYQTYELLAEQVADELSPYFDRPFGFFGHCGGAHVAYAAALHLARHGSPTPACVFVSAQVAPHDGPYGRYLGLSDAELAAELAQLTRAAGGEPRPDVIEMNVRVMRADLTAARSYKLGAPVELPSLVRAVGWDGDDVIPHGQMGGWPACPRPGRFHWALLAGGHYTLGDAPDELMAELDEGMRTATASLRAAPAGRPRKHEPDGTRPAPADPGRTDRLPRRWRGSTRVRAARRRLRRGRLAGGRLATGRAAVLAARQADRRDGDGTGQRDHWLAVHGPGFSLRRTRTRWRMNAFTRANYDEIPAAV